MKTIYGKNMTALRAALLFVSMAVGEAFVSTSPAAFVHPFAKTTTTTTTETRPTFTPNTAQVASTTTPSSSALSMGLFEDFLADRDSSQRSKENEVYLKELSARVDRINELDPVYEKLDDAALKAKTQEFQKRLAAGEDINGPLLEEAFAVVREASWRVLDLHHYDVQLLGGLILHDGRLAEMATGEGKTLVSTLPVYVNALMGQPSFVITVNDYLAKRDMEKMGQIHRFLGLTVGLIQSGMSETERRDAYSNNVVYVTNSELGFDYLRDHLALSPAQTVLPSSRGSGEFDGFCVVDEADSVLIDEARTPLIISKQVPAPANYYAVAQQLADALVKDVHYTVDLKNKNCVLTEQGFQESEKALGIDSLFFMQADGNAWAPYVINAVKAKELFTKDVEYTILTDASGTPNGVGIIDAFTGRVLDGRRWSDGLHQSIEAREGINVSEQSQVIAKVTYQSLFRQFTRLSGMTGTASSDASELETTYGLKVTPVPTALPVARRDYPDVAFKTRLAANKALVNEVTSVIKQGRPCLIGTTSVAQSEQLVSLLAENEITAELLNASPKNAPRESEIVAQAGRAGAVTVATNMAGRGTDILLGGCHKTMARIKTRSFLMEQGMLAPEELASIPSAPSDEYFPCDLDDEAEALLQTATQVLKKKFGMAMTAIALDELLTVAIEGVDFEDDEEYLTSLRDATESIAEMYEEVLEEEKEAVKKAGGLYVMGTNRHESTRIDQQLRGRAGRQGDPGSSRFFLSFEDDMFVIFGGDGLQNILKMFRVGDDLPVEAPQVTDALDKVQRAVEEKYREIRKEILNFDEILNEQRRIIYSRRRKILNSSPEESLAMMKSYNDDTVDEIVDAQTSEDGSSVDTAKVVQKVTQFFPPLAAIVQESDITGKDPVTVSAVLKVAVDEVFQRRKQQIPNLGKSANYITLVTMDNAWSDHLQAMENLKEAVVLRKYEGRDPFAEYTNEAFVLFKGLEEAMRRNAQYSLWQSLAAAPQAAAAAAA